MLFWYTPACHFIANMHGVCTAGARRGFGVSRLTVVALTRRAAVGVCSEQQLLVQVRQHPVSGARRSAPTTGDATVAEPATHEDAEASEVGPRRSARATHPSTRYVGPEWQ